MGSWQVAPDEWTRDRRGPGGMMGSAQFSRRGSRPGPAQLKGSRWEPRRHTRTRSHTGNREISGSPPLNSQPGTPVHLSQITQSAPLRLRRSLRGLGYKDVARRTLQLVKVSARDGRPIRRLARVDGSHTLAGCQLRTPRQPSRVDGSCSAHRVRLIPGSVLRRP